MDALHEGEEGLEAGSGQANIYSIVVTEISGKTGFELFLLKGMARRPDQIADDLARAQAWIARSGLQLLPRSGGEVAGERAGRTL
jgi:hypothetical protein